MMCTAAAPRGLTGHITWRYKLSVRNQMSEKAPEGEFLRAFREGNLHTQSFTHPYRMYVKYRVNQKRMETSKRAQRHTSRTQTNKPAHVGFHGWLVWDNERLDLPPS